LLEKSAYGGTGGEGSHMIQVRALLIATVTWFILLFNIERFDVFDYQQPVNLSTTLYMTIIVTAVSLLSFPNLAKANLWFSATTMTIFYLGMSMLSDATALQATFFWRATEIGILLISFVLMQKVSQAILDFEIAVQSFVLDANNSRMMPFHQGQEQVSQELHRARRFERPVAIIYCESASNDDTVTKIDGEFWQWRIKKTFKDRFTQTHIAQSAAMLTYKSDCIIKYNNDIVICLPETNQPEGEAFAAQLARFIHDLHQIEANIGVATFPDDGLVFEDLIEIARERARAYPPDIDSDGRSHDVMVNTQQRIKIERDAAWVNRMAYQSPSARSIYGFIKRTVEITLVLAVMPVVMPVLLIIALLIYLDDGAPIFYMQPRTGYRGKRFKIFKFRTMRVNAPSQPAQIVIDANGRKRYIWPEKKDKDPRITRVGAVLRKTSLDELPQLLNVLTGDMSLVGPRPTTWDLDMYTLQQTERLTVRPGITGLWQVCSRESTNMDERLLWDLKYIDKMSLSLDIQIIWRTVNSVFQKKGA
jgi:lipopolysaccharide/colanic/teichoic acid biosynthesis glycosyltransferase